MSISQFPAAGTANIFLQEEAVIKFVVLFTFYSMEMDLERSLESFLCT